jgi:hypothetical protein
MQTRQRPESAAPTRTGRAPNGMKRRPLLLLRVTFGIGVGVPIGFLLYAIAYGSEAESFKSWITHPARNYLLGWLAYGAVMGALWHFISEAAKNSN